MLKKNFNIIMTDVDRLIDPFSNILNSVIALSNSGGGVIFLEGEALKGFSLWFYLKMHFLSASRIQESKTAGAKPKCCICSSTILPIPCKRHSCMCHLHPDLMMSSCIQFDFYEKAFCFFMDHLI